MCTNSECKSTACMHIWTRSSKCTLGYIYILCTLLTLLGLDMPCEKFARINQLYAFLPFATCTLNLVQIYCLSFFQHALFAAKTINNISSCEIANRDVDVLFFLTQKSKVKFCADFSKNKNALYRDEKIQVL